MSVDVVTAEIVRNGLTAAADEMAKTLCRTAYNPLLYDVQDFGLGIVSARGDLWAASGAHPLFIGTLADTVRGALATRGRDGFREGDVLIVNDPYLTGTHISDTCVYAPLFVDGELVAFALATAHWADIGGKSPGGWCPDTTDVYQEGICFSHEALVRSGVRDEALWSLIASNVRYPALVLGDLEAQIAACRQGGVRLQALCGRVGLEPLQEAMAWVLAQTDASMRSIVAELADGVYRAGIEMDHDGVHHGDPFRVELTVTVEGPRLCVSFAGSSPAQGGPVNVPAAGARNMVRAALKGLLAPLDLSNEGHFLLAEFADEPGLVVSAERPAPVDSYGYVCVALCELAIRALAPALPESCPAGGGQLFGAFLFRVDPREGAPFIFIDPMDVGNGARPDGDGPTLMFLGNGDVLNTPVEVAEARYPVRIERFGLRPSSAGAGAWRGGMGVQRDVRILEGGVLMQCANENTRAPLARGLAGGGDGTPSLIVVAPGSEREQIVAERTSFYGPFPPGELVSIRSGGGGGHGVAVERDPARVADDVRDELVSAEEARETYAVALVADGVRLRVDEPGTRELRRVAA